MKSKNRRSLGSKRSWDQNLTKVSASKFCGISRPTLSKMIETFQVPAFIKAGRKLKRIERENHEVLGSDVFEKAFLLRRHVKLLRMLNGINPRKKPKDLVWIFDSVAMILNIDDSELGQVMSFESEKVQLGFDWHRNTVLSKLRISELDLNKLIANGELDQSDNCFNSNQVIRYARNTMKLSYVQISFEFSPDEDEGIGRIVQIRIDGVLYEPAELSKNILIGAVSAFFESPEKAQSRVVGWNPSVKRV
ncbi:hypothetical protein IQ258_19675 [Coleofasciculus sp. LEGE 07081]|uniref:hypothetical protein n=1 Tax=Coleofasciculus sp. LEGE 07081 TaxID=2777967 RepID=UPI00187F1D0B|nr:hypothetical protein [Coleofasciculus sp. LEGE 07081]MBE9128323.1 hypothetical protein [Coleofasciculus sp. LEGE 07081]